MRSSCCATVSRLSRRCGCRPARSTVPQLAAPVSLDADDLRCCSQVVDYYHATLKQSPEALAYLEARGLDHPELIERSGWAMPNRTLGYRLPEKNRKAGADSAAACSGSASSGRAGTST